MGQPTDTVSNIDEAEELWRCEPVRDRLAFALENDEKYTDVDFLVGEKEVRISAHKLILRLSSLVFENLINSLEAEGFTEIRLPNTTPVMFKRLLQFIYTDQLEMNELTGFLKVAKDFGFNKLGEQSIRILKKTKINKENVPLMLAVAEDLKDLELEQFCLLFIQSNSKEVITSKEFVHLPYAGLCKVLQDDKLDVDELTIFRAVVRWAEFQARKNGVELTDETRRRFLKEARMHIRYTLMTYDQLLADVKSSGVLLQTEFLQILKTYLDPSDNLLGICTKPRAFKRIKEVVPTKPLVSKEIPQASAVPIIMEHRLPAARVSGYTPVPAPIVPSGPMMNQCNFSDDVMIIEPPAPPPMAYSYPPALPQREPFEPFEFPSNPPDSYYRVENCTIELLEVVSATRQMQNTLQNISFHNVFLSTLQFPPEGPQGFKSYLPKLESFHFFQDKPPVCPPALPDYRFKCGMSTREFLFFEKDPVISWTLTNLVSLGMHISIDVSGIQLLDVNPKKLKLTLTYPDPIECGLILEGLSLSGIALKTLSLAHCSMKTPNKIPTNNLENLVLHNVGYQDGQTNKPMRFINQCTALKNLSLNLHTQAVNDMFLATDMVKCRNSLERLALSNMGLMGWSVKNQLKSPSFKALQELYLDSCNWRSNFAEYFSKKFPVLRKLYIRYRQSCRPNATFIRNILEVSTLDRLVVFRHPSELYNHDKRGNAVDEESMTPAVVDDMKYVYELLLNAGIVFPFKGVANCHNLPDFIIQRDLMPMGGSAGGWKAVYDLSELDWTHFHCSMLFEFYADAEVARMCEQ